MTHIHKVKPNILYCTYICGSKNDLLYKLLSRNDSSTEVKSSDEINNILHKLLSNILNTNLPLVKEFVFCSWKYGSHYHEQKIQTNFYNTHNLILAGEWVHSYHGSLEGSCMSAIDTFKIINQNIYKDKLARKI